MLLKLTKTIETNSRHRVGLKLWLSGRGLTQDLEFKHKENTHMQTQRHNGLVQWLEYLPRIEMTLGWSPSTPNKKYNKYIHSFVFFKTQLEKSRKGQQTSSMS